MNITIIYWQGRLIYKEIEGTIKALVKLNYKFWLFLLETNTSYYIKTKYDSSLENYIDETANIPDWQFIGGLYVNDLFFDNNLDLKAGFKFYYTGEINSSVRWWWGSTIVEPTNKLDFNLAGEIQKVAIFYFQWENLFGNEYYITPHYPMPERNIKFGIAWELFNYSPYAGEVKREAKIKMSVFDHSFENFMLFGFRMKSVRLLHR
jgi:hypothetical protein